MQIGLPIKGDYGCVRTTGWQAWLIRLGTFSRYNHAVVFVGGDQVIEARPNGAGYAPIPRDVVWSHEPLSSAQRAGVVNAATALIGTPYDWRSILGFIVRFWGRHLRPMKERNARKKMICSELVVWAYMVGANIDLAPNVAPGDVSPGDLADRITRAPAGLSHEQQASVLER